MKASLEIDMPFIKQGTEKKGPYITATLGGSRLSTALQPIYSLAHKRIVGHEALVRATDNTGRPVSPDELFGRNRPESDMIHLDRLCRYIHMQNYKLLNDSTNWLFLNVSPKTICSGKSYGSFFKDLIEECRFPAHRIVIEVVEYPINDNNLIQDTIEYYKDLGCLIAIDDFGAGHSNFNRIWSLKPDIVKLDRSFITRAETHSDIKNLLEGIVTLLHQAGSLVLMEGIETSSQALTAIASDVDFVQGFFFEKPFTDLQSPPQSFTDFSNLTDQYKRETDLTEDRFQEDIQHNRTQFTQAVNRLKKGIGIEQACDDLLQRPDVVRCYLIGTDGVQIGKTLVSRSYIVSNDKRFKPLEDAKSADWFRRHYLKRAILHPEQLQITRPYFSITGAHMCMTLSMKFSGPSGEGVLCCDLKAQGSF